MNIELFPWGDTIRTDPETWDDGNLDDGDGCSSHCKLETGCAWFVQGSYIADICDWWGSGKRFSQEKWDDGNTINGDGCSSTWTVETYFNCTGGSETSKDICTAICGDGTKKGNEEWDDSNIKNGDGCSSTCTLEGGYISVNGSAVGSIASYNQVLFC